MLVLVVIGLLVGALVGGACMALWAANRIEDEAARQFDCGVEHGRWLAVLATKRALEPPGRSRRARLLAGERPGERTPPDGPPPLPLP